MGREEEQVAHAWNTHHAFCGVQGARAPAGVDLDRPRKVAFGGTARKPAPMLEPLNLTVKLMVKAGGGKLALCESTT